MQHTVLVVDDEPSVVRYVSELLRRAGYAVIAAVGPHAALEAFTSSPASIALVLADIVMPEIKGVELIARLRKARPELPYILMTGFSDDALMQYHQINVDGMPVLHKPFTSDALLAHIREALGRRGGRR